MSHGYTVFGWTPFKKRYDLWMLLGIVVYLVVFILVASVTVPEDESFTPVQILIRATGTLAFLLLTFILCIGPLARMTPRFKPFLFNRRHLGVTTFLIALVHGALVILWYHGFGSLNPFVSLFVSNPEYGSIAEFPFEALGFVALLTMFLMAATSHDFWNANLGPGLWKAIHMAVYIAYGLLIAHVALGAIQYEKSPVYIALIVAAAVLVAGLHLFSGIKSAGTGRAASVGSGWIEAGPVGDIPEDRALILSPDTGERIAVFWYDGKVAAVSNVCRHQGGPLGEGRIVDGCITCPWHGFQYRPEDGCSPPPFTEKIATYETRIENGVVLVNPDAKPPGTAVAPSSIAPGTQDGATS